MSIENEKKLREVVRNVSRILKLSLFSKTVLCVQKYICLYTKIYTFSESFIYTYKSSHAITKYIQKIVNQSIKKLEFLWSKVVQIQTYWV